jgi:uncharacterized membrane protein
MANMKGLLKTAKNNIIPIVIGIGIIVTIVVLAIIFTDINPIIVGSVAGIFLGFIIPALIYRIRMSNVESKYKFKDDEKTIDR